MDLLAYQLLNSLIDPQIFSKLNFTKDIFLFLFIIKSFKIPLIKL